jgi:adenylate kinase
VCGNIYHVEFRPPVTPGRCDLDGAELVSRRDDTPDTALHRLHVFREQTAPLIEHYRRRGALLSVAAERPTEDVYAAIWEALRSRSDDRVRSS